MFNNQTIENNKSYYFLFLCITNLLSICGDIDTNPGPRFSSLTFCH